MKWETMSLEVSMGERREPALVEEHSGYLTIEELQKLWSQQHTEIRQEIVFEEPGVEEVSVQVRWISWECGREVHSSRKTNALMKLQLVVIGDIS